MTEVTNKNVLTVCAYMVSLAIVVGFFCQHKYLKVYESAANAFQCQCCVYWMACV